jgi:cell division protein FtsA
LGCGLVLTGGGAKLKHIKEFVEYHTGLSIRVGNPEEKIITGKESEWYHPMYATGLGLLVMGIEKDEDLHPVAKEVLPKSVPEKEEKVKKEPKAPKEPKIQKEENVERERYRPWTKIQEMLNSIIIDEENNDEDDDF